MAPIFSARLVQNLSLVVQHLLFLTPSHTPEQSQPLLWFWFHWLLMPLPPDWSPFLSSDSLNTLPVGHAHPLLRGSSLQVPNWIYHLPSAAMSHFFFSQVLAQSSTCHPKTRCHTQSSPYFLPIPPKSIPPSHPYPHCQSPPPSLAKVISKAQIRDLVPSLPLSQITLYCCQNGLCQAEHIIPLIEPLKPLHISTPSVTRVNKLPDIWEGQKSRSRSPHLQHEISF